MHGRWKPRARPEPPTPEGAAPADLDTAVLAVLGWIGVLGVYQHRLYVGRIGDIAEVAIDIYFPGALGRGTIDALGVERHGTRSIEEAATRVALVALRTRQRVRILFRGFIFDLYPAPPVWAARIVPTPFPLTSLSVEEVIDIERRGQV